jgi:hypothetical protein
LLISLFILTNLISMTYAQVFEFDAEDSYESIGIQSNTYSEDSSTLNSEDSDNENCINNQIESVLSSSTSSSSSNSDTNSNDPYISNFHFVKKFDQNGNLVDSWGTVGPKDGQFLHAHGITVDSQDNVYVSDAEKCNI